MDVILYQTSKDFGLSKQAPQYAIKVDFLDSVQQRLAASSYRLTGLVPEQMPCIGIY